MAALLATLVALTTLWALLPRPQLGTGTVGITRLAAPPRACHDTPTTSHHESRCQ
ncbi:hypothetical protein ABT034_15820 [Streptomyces sp. NPDC002773]|uniref:hypothetical protein n=1 Tax=Streptomyces sp. NPDC002773 TaxID=3154430 RepID=UPI00332832A3